MLVKSAVLCCALMCLALTIETSSVNARQKLYQVRGRKLAGLVDAATQFRHFLKTELSQSQRCERYGIMLDKFRKDRDSLDYFQLAEIGVMSREKAAQEFGKITFDQLRNHYKEGVNSFREANQINAAMVEMYRCLQKYFKRHDADALKFLNDRQLQDTVAQYESITSQPASLLVDGQHPYLKLEQLQPAVANSVSRWSELAELFPSVNQSPKVYQAEAKASAQAGHLEPRQAATEVRQPSLEQPPLMSTPRAAHAEPVQWTSDEAKYLSDISRAIIATYDSLPDETPAYITCLAYNELIKASQQADNLKDPNLVQRVIKETLDREEQNKPRRDFEFFPEEEERANFLFVLQSFDLSQGGEGAWTDMAWCASGWVNVDEEVRDYFESEEFKEIVKKHQSPEESVKPTAAGQPVAPSA